MGDFSDTSVKVFNIYLIRMLNIVLIIDDDEITHIIGKRLIEIAGFAKKTVTLENGKEAIDYFENLLKNQISPNKQEDVPDFILLDINMPIMNGWEFLKEYTIHFSNKFPHIKVAILSSSINPEDLKKSEESSLVVDYISKPLTIERLTELSVSLSK